MEENQIDIHNHTKSLQRELDRFAACEQISDRNRDLIARFVREARIGRSTRGGRCQRVSPARCRKLLTTLKACAGGLNAPLDEVTPDEMERFIVGLEEGSIEKQVMLGGTRRYRVSTVLDFKKILRKFYRWLWPNDPNRVEELTGWFDTRERAPELKTFTIDDARRRADAVGSIQGRALVMLLFDGGFRAGELFNVRLADIRFRADAGSPTCYVRIRVSKTKPRTISLPLATETTRFWIERHPDGGPIGDDGLVRARDPSATLITWSYAYCRKILARVGRQELGERLYFHRFRHASATFYARRLSQYQLAARFGWTMGSRSVQRYVDHCGVLADEVNAIMRAEGNPQDTVRKLADELARHPELCRALRDALGPA